MTPEEKAKQLIDRFIPLYDGIKLNIAKRHWAIQSAVILVDELVENNFWTGEDYQKYIEYWHNVRAAISQSKTYEPNEK